MLIVAQILSLLRKRIWLLLHFYIRILRITYVCHRREDLTTASIVVS
jgi:hypothetical protein